jgi:acyl-CoA thioester hydrolase
MDSVAPNTMSGYPITVTIPVQWGDQDAFGHVNNTIFLRWFESARIAYFLRIGLDHSTASDRIGPILAAITCNFRAQVCYPDTVHVGARVTRIGRSSLTMEHSLILDSSRAIAADGTSTIVVFDYKAGRSHPVPDPLRRAIESLEGKSL